MVFVMCLAFKSYFIKIRYLGLYTLFKCYFRSNIVLVTCTILSLRSCAKKLKPFTVFTLYIYLDVFFSLYALYNSDGSVTSSFFHFERTALQWHIPFFIVFWNPWCFMITVINRPVLWCLFTKHWQISHSTEVSELSKRQRYKTNSRKHWGTETLSLRSAFSLVLLSLKQTETFIKLIDFHDMNVRMLLFFPR